MVVRNGVYVPNFYTKYYDVFASKKPLVVGKYTMRATFNLQHKDKPTVIPSSIETPSGWFTFIQKKREKYRIDRGRHSPLKAHWDFSITKWDQR